MLEGSGKEVDEPEISAMTSLKNRSSAFCSLSVVGPSKTTTTFLNSLFALCAASVAIFPLAFLRAAFALSRSATAEVRKGRLTGSMVVGEREKTGTYSHPSPSLLSARRLRRAEAVGEEGVRRVRKPVRAQGERRVVGKDEGTEGVWRIHESETRE